MTDKELKNMKKRIDKYIEKFDKQIKKICKTEDMGELNQLHSDTEEMLKKLILMKVSVIISETKKSRTPVTSKIH